MSSASPIVETSPLHYREQAIQYSKTVIYKPIPVKWIPSVCSICKTTQYDIYISTNVKRNKIVFCSNTCQDIFRKTIKAINE